MSHKIQHIEEGAIVYIASYEFVVRAPYIERGTGVPDRVLFWGECTDDPHNDPIRGTMFDGGLYGGNHLIYSWRGQR